MTIHEDYLRYLDHFGETCTVREAVERRDEPNLIALRHDVDHDIDVALEMGYWEHQRGIRSTYYVLPTAPYWNDPRLTQKCLQLTEFGHEVGLHLNSMPGWLKGESDSVEDDLRGALQKLREGGIEVVGTSPHGDPLCYEQQFINYWCFRELEPEDPVTTESGLTAEGVRSHRATKSIEYPVSGQLRRDDGDRFEFWSVSMADLGLVYDAIHVPVTSCFSDSGGGWTLTGDPLQEELSSGRAQILMHPIHWRGEPRIYFFLSTARSGSTWVSEVLDRATPFESRHEFTLNHEFEQGNPAASKQTRDNLNELLDDPDEVQRLLTETRDWLEEHAMDYAEPNVYLAHFLDQLKVEFPDAELVFLHRHPARVVRSLVNRDWYDTPDDHRHPVIGIDGWEELDQFSKVCWYVRTVNRELMVLPHRVSLERMARDIETLSQELERLGIPFYPVLAGDALTNPLNASQTYDFPAYESWDPRTKDAFEWICGPVCQALSYEIDGHPPASSSAKRSPSETERRAERIYTERTLFAFDSVPRKWTNAWRITCLGMLTKLDSRARRDGARSPAPMQRLWFGWKPHQRTWFLGRGCQIDTSAHSPTVEFSESTTHAHVVIGGGEWYRLPAGRGWPATLGSWYRGEIEVEGDTESPVILYCLMYDRQGQQVYRRSLVKLSNHQPRRRFGFKTRRFADRFCLALYFPASDQRRAVRLLELKLKERSNTRLPPSHRSFDE